MSNLSKIIICILLLSLLLAGGCGSDDVTPDRPIINPNDQDFTYEPMGETVISPIVIPYVVDNPIEIIEIEVSDGKFEQSYFQISGLADPGVEMIVNESIKSLFDQLIPYATGEKLVPYRGIQTLVQSNIVNGSTITITPQLNCNNVLSVFAHLSGSYSTFSTRNIWFSMIETLNIDLTTGEEFLLEDVFTNDVSGLDIVNAAVLSELRNPMLDYSFDLVAPFRGITHKHKFYLSYYGINIVFDHNNPEFDVGFSNYILSVPLSSPDGHIAITQRFFNQEQSVFTREATSKRFLYNYQMAVKHEQHEYLENGTEWNVSVHYPADLHQDIVAVILDIQTQQQELISRQFQQQGVSFIEQSIYARPLGKFININSNLYLDGDTDSQWWETRYVYSQTGKVNLNDLFTEGFDYRTIIRDALEEGIKEYGYQDADLDVLLGDLAFALGDTRLQLNTITYDWGLDRKHPLHFYIEYHDIGFENLTIFD